MSSVVAPAEGQAPPTDPTAAPPAHDARRSGGAHLASRGTRRPWALLETSALLASPVIGFYVLRLRAMAPPVLPDPSMSSTYIFDPRDYFYRFNTTFTPTARMREGARVGFLVPARLSYLAFGAVPGFFVLRYVLAVVAIIPAYLLLRRLYGVGAGVLAVVTIMSSPVIVTAWGTDFPDSAVVSYLLGGVACLLMPAAARRARVAWLVAAAFLFTMAVWALATCAALVAVILAAYLVVGLVGERSHLWIDVVLLGVVAVAVTVGLAGASAAEFGQLDYIRPTINSIQYLATPSQEAMWHSANWRWAPYEAYVLVPPALAAAWMVVGRRWRSLGSAQLVVALATVGEVVAALLLQFVAKVQILEEHFFYSTLWAALLLGLVVLLAELTRPLATHRLWRFAPAVLVVAVALAYETDPHVPAMRWLPVAAILAVGLVGVAYVAQRLASGARPALSRVASGMAVVGIVGVVLVLTVAPSPNHKLLVNTAYNPPTGYDTALGGNANELVDDYRLISGIHAFTGKATYRGEQVLTCWTSADQELMDAIGQFHAAFNLLPGYCPDLGPADARMIRFRRPAQILVVSETPVRIHVMLRHLAGLGAFVARSEVRRAGPYDLRLWLVEIPRYLAPNRAAGRPLEYPGRPLPG